MSDCYVCRKHEEECFLPGGIIYKDESIFVAHYPFEGNPEVVHLGHIIIETIRHIETPSEMTEEEATGIGRWIQKISEAQETVMKAEHVYIFRIGDKTPHLHFHVIPRFEDTPKEFWGMNMNEWPQGPKGDETTIKDISNQFRERFGIN